MNDDMNEQPPSLEQPPVVEQPVENPELKQLVEQFNGGAGWFYFIAALSVINSLLVLFGTEWAFIFGLGVTQVVDGLARAIVGEIGEGSAVWIVRGIAFLFNLGIAGFFVLFGWLAKRGYGAAFLIGIIIYLFDGLLFLLAGDWLGLGFHAFALFLMVRGYTALRKIRAMQTQAAQ